MKNQFKGFILGLFTATTIGAFGVTALAAANVIEIHPISIMVNGKVFEPKDANGASVPVFTYNGTTYAPLRALGEAFGQKIGFDAVNNIATVGEVPVVEKPVDTIGGYEDFKSMWTLERAPNYMPGTGGCLYYAKYTGIIPTDEIISIFKSNNADDKETLGDYQMKFAQEIYADFKIQPTGDTLVLRFIVDGLSLGQTTWIQRN